MQLASQTTLFLSNDQTGKPCKGKEIKIPSILKELKMSVDQFPSHQGVRGGLFPSNGFILSQLSELLVRILVLRVIKDCYC